MTLPPESADKTACGSAAINEAGSFPEGGYAGIDTREYWKNWKWQVRHAIRSIDTVQQVLGITFDPEERSQLQKTVDKFPLCITPYYLSLIDTEDYRNDPIFRQAFPSPAELIVENYELSDPLSEDKDSPCECITHRYPDRVLFLISNTCAMYCRHCTRKRKVGDLDSIPDREKIQEGIAYIRENSHIRDVLLSGGDPLMLSDEVLDWILTELSAIPHVEVIRIGTRVPVVLPFRITDELVGILKKAQTDLDQHAVQSSKRDDELGTISHCQTCRCRHTAWKPVGSSRTDQRLPNHHERTRPSAGEEPDTPVLSLSV